MSEGGQRPGGLTVLAILSFIWGGLLVLSCLALIVMVAVGKQKDLQGPKGEVEVGWLWLQIGGALLSGAILIVAGVGFLGQRRVVGRWMGTAYALLTLAILTVVQAIEPRLFSFDTVMSAVYALLILLLVNLTFRRDLVR